MVEIKVGRPLRTVDLPYTLRLYGVTEEMFDELVDEDTKAELIDGVMIVHSPASPRHDKVSAFLRSLLNGFAEEKGFGEAFGPDSLVHFATCRRFGPDAFLLAKSQIPDPLPETQFEEVPPLVVEVLSPSNREDDLNDKRPAYHEAGVREIWLVDLEQEKVTVDRWRGGRYVTSEYETGKIASVVLKGFWIEADWLWASPLPKLMTCLRKILR
jgi:Uma2 family endonuclease